MFAAGKPRTFLGFATVAVSGPSMEPTYSDGDWLLVHWRGNPSGTLYAKPGNIVVIEREQQPGIFYVKRIKEISDAGVYVMSDNSAGTDSRTWGYLQKEEVIARVIARIRKSK